MSATTMTLPRQPFGSVSGARLRNLTQTKNKQNSLQSALTSPVKRHVPDEFEDNDSENVDPLTFFSSSKKSKTFDFDSTTLEKPPSFCLNTAHSTPAKRVQTPQVASRKRKADDSPAISDIADKYPKQCEPSSAPPAPAGRSPKHKRIGILSKRRATQSKFTRVDPPSSELKTGLPFSINAALASTVPLKTKPKISKSWQFEIYEDSPEDEMANLMEHSTCTLDISDDESRAIREDRDNKENIPPLDQAIGVHVSTTRGDLMTDDARSPLGDLDAKDFYAAGCDASSFILVPSEDETSSSDKIISPANIDEAPSPSRRRSNAITEHREGWEDVLAHIVAEKDPIIVHEDTVPEQKFQHAHADVQSLEGKSTKDEDETLVEKT